MDTSSDGENVKVSTSRIPTSVGGFRRSASVRVRGEKPFMSPILSTPFPSIAEKEELSFHDKKTLNQRKLISFGLNRSRSQASGLNHQRDEDLESVDSFASGISIASSSCEHAYFAKNGTTFSGRNNKYVVHCPSHANTPEEYLTPTQRANKNIRRLKTLLQLAKDKLTEKEQEIFKLTKEVVELKVYKASLNHTHFSEESSPSEEKEVEACLKEQDKVCRKGFSCDTYNDLSPIKTSYYFDDKEKISPGCSPHGEVFDKLSATPDYLLCSLADSGNFDDMASSVSVGFSITPDLRPLPDESKAQDVLFYSSLDVSYTDHTDSLDHERSHIVSDYVGRLNESKDKYENELKRIMEEQELKNIETIENFEGKLKQQETEFEEKYQGLVSTCEEEKMKIVERFETRLKEEKERYKECLVSTKQNGGRITDMIPGEDYVAKVEEEKKVYESSLTEIKYKFENEKTKMENMFDDAMAAERKKFDESVADIKRTCDKQVADLMQKVEDAEAKCREMEALETRNAELKQDSDLIKQSYQEQEERHRSTYLKMFVKGQEAEKIKHADEVAEFAAQAPTRVSIPELLVQLKVTETELENLKAMYKRLAEAQDQQPQPVATSRNCSEAEATLQFLKSAVYYFLTDYENQMGHLRAIESILGFTEIERRNIDKTFLHK